jgi:hypothetical protein
MAYSESYILDNRDFEVPPFNVPYLFMYIFFFEYMFTLRVTAALSHKIWQPCSAGQICI